MYLLQSISTFTLQRDQGHWKERRGGWGWGWGWGWGAGKQFTYQVLVFIK